MTTDEPSAELTRVQRRAVEELLRISPVVDELGVRFAKAGHELYLVGGSVRDALLGRLGDDLDFTTDAHPDAIEALVDGWAHGTWTTGKRFGTIGAQRGEFRLEITTYRTESYDVDSRKPDVQFGTSLTDDLLRRDFTVNAMAVAIPQRVFVDPFGGLADLAGRRLRTPGLPENSFGDDPLRMLRAARFAAQLGFVVAPEVVAAMRAMAERLRIVSAERIAAELNKLLLSPDPRTGLALLVDTGIAAVVLPELPALRLSIDPVHRHKDVYDHTLAVLERAMSLEPAGPDLTLRMAALLHDIGKPKTRRFEEEGGVSFHHHEVVGRDMTRNRLVALKYPKTFIDDVATLVELHLRFHGYSDAPWTDAGVRRYVRDAGHLLDRLHLLVRSDCTTRNKGKADRLSRAYDDLERRIAELAEQEELDSIRPDLDGSDIMRVLDVAPGRIVGQARNFLLELRIERGPLPHEEALRELLAWAAGQGLAVPSYEEALARLDAEPLDA
ncbi:MAG: poly(A) polymerase [Frankiaceae bacterium]|nr:poly(A) polymerase [Frankiaceae bacterium]MDQ1715756.1 poly(A) polymerase [Frankiaceae bacterium]